MSFFTWERNQLLTFPGPYWSLLWVFSMFFLYPISFCALVLFIKKKKIIGGGATGGVCGVCEGPRSVNIGCLSSTALHLHILRQVLVLNFKLTCLDSWLTSFRVCLSSPPNAIDPGTCHRHARLFTWVLAFWTQQVLCWLSHLPRPSYFSVHANLVVLRRSSWSR